MNNAYILLTLLILGTLTIIGMFIHINAKVGMRKAFIELINRKSFVAISVIMINTVMSFTMIHFNNLDKLPQPAQSESIHQVKEEYPHQKEFEDYLKSKNQSPNLTTPYKSSTGIYYDQNSNAYEYVDNEFKEF